jgi:hypothetical protein
MRYYIPIQSDKPPRKLPFWPLSATFEADSGQKQKILEDLRASKPPAEEATA